MNWFHRRSARLDQARTRFHDRQTALLHRERRAKGALLGDEHVARATPKKHKMWLDMWLERYQAAIRANRQLALALQGQGLNEEGADHHTTGAHHCLVSDVAALRTIAPHSGQIDV
jgi:hypothetical protein